MDIVPGLRIGDDQSSTFHPTLTDLLADLMAVEFPGKRRAYQFGQFGHGSQYAQRVPVNEHEARIRINLLDCPEREHMVRAFEHPLPPAHLVLEVLQKTFVETKGREMPFGDQPLLV